MTAFTPAQIEALHGVRAAFPDAQIAIIGAAALAIHMPMNWRITADLDVALAVSFDDLDGIPSKLPGWAQHPKQEQRWREQQELRCMHMGMRNCLSFILLLTACEGASDPNDAGNAAESDASQGDLFELCGVLGEVDCVDDARCMALYAQPAIDGGEADLEFVACIPEDGCELDGDSLTCASNENGDMFIFPSQCIPPSWSAECNTTS